MANLVDKKEIEVVEKDKEVKNMENKDQGVSSVDLPAPDGWKKKFVPKKSGTPTRNKIIFISPTGEEITNKRQLDQFLKAHPGPSAAEFDWTPGSTPRRSARISEKSKATESPEDEPGQKRERKSSSKKGAMGNSAVVAEEAPKEEENAAGEEIKESTDVEMKEVEGGEDKNADKITTVEAMQDVEMKEVEGGEDKNADKITTVEAMQEGFEAKTQEIIPENSDSIENPEVQEANLKNDSDAKEIQTEKTATPEVTETESSEAPAPVTGSNGEAANEKEAKVGKESSEEDVMVGDVVSSENPTKGETLPDNNSNSKGTHLLNSEEAEDQLKAPPVSC